MAPPDNAGMDATPAQPDTDTTEAGRLLTLLTRQRDHYLKLRELSQQQASLIAAGQPEKLLTLLGRRQGHVEALTTLNEQLTPLRPRMAALTQAAPADRRDAIRARVDEVQALLAEIIAQDEADSAELAQQKENKRQALIQTRPAKAALGAYRSANGAVGGGFTARSA